MQWDTQQAEANPTQLKYKLSTITAYIQQGGQRCPDRIELSSGDGSAASFNYYYFRQKFSPSSARSSKGLVAAREMGRIQRYREQKSLTTGSISPKSRRFCIISYKSPIQTELMEKYTSKQPLPATTSQQPHKEIYKYKLHENCTVHSLAGLGCSSLSRGMWGFSKHVSRIVCCCFVKHELGHACCSQ